jgi:hypothetical protein
MMKLDPVAQAPTSPELSEVDHVPVDCSAGYYVMVMLPHSAIYAAHLRSSTKTAADEYAARFVSQDKLEGVQPSKWPKRVRDELIKRFVKAHRRDDQETTAVLAHVVAAMIDSPFFIIGVTGKGKLKWTKSYPTGSATDLKARVMAALDSRSEPGVHTVMANAIRSQHFFPAQAQVRQAQTQIQALRVAAGEFYSGKAFDDIVPRDD